MSQFESLLVGAPPSTVEFIQYLCEQRETAFALASLVDPKVDFASTELGSSFCTELTQMLGLGSEADTVKAWVDVESKGNPAFVIGAGMYLEGVKFVADCLLLKKAS